MLWRIKGAFRGVKDYLPLNGAAAAAKLLQSCPTLCDPVDGSLAGSPVPGILQAGTLEWLPFSSPLNSAKLWKYNLVLCSLSLSSL